MIGIALSLLLAAGPARVTPARLPRPASDAPSEPPRPRARRDEPIRASEYVDLVLRHDAGRVEILSATRGRYPAPTTARRYAGRFEVWQCTGATATEPFAFDFPLTAPAEVEEVSGQDRAFARSLATHVRAEITLRVPLLSAADGLAIIDTAPRRDLHHLALAAQGRQVPTSGSALPDAGLCRAPAAPRPPVAQRPAPPEPR